VKATTAEPGLPLDARHRAAFEPIAREIVEVDAPGLSSSNLSRFAFTRIRRPIFPLDPDAGYPAAAPA
jgi:microcystin degradation protein MlrC